MTLLGGVLQSLARGVRWSDG